MLVPIVIQELLSITLLIFISDKLEQKIPKYVFKKELKTVLTSSHSNTGAHVSELRVFLNLSGIFINISSKIIIIKYLLIFLLK